MKCSKCGAELNGNKFCTNCGTPAPQETTETVNQPVEYNNPYVEDNTQPVQNNADTAQNTYQQDSVVPVQQPNNGYTGQQFTNSSNGTYAGQQFTNKPNVAPNGKKPMSGGKIAIIVVSIVLGLIIILGIIVGVVACTVNKVLDVAKDGISIYDDDLSSAADRISSYLDSYSSDLESNSLYDYSSDIESKSSSGYSSTEIVSDSETGFDFQRSKYYNGWAVVDYTKVDYDESKITLEIPEQFLGEDVVEIKRLYIYDNDYTENGYIKIIIPGTVKVIDEYSMSFLEDINEVVIEEGVQKIEEDAFIGDTDLLKVHIPASVTDIDDDCGIGFGKDDDIPLGKDFTLYCTAGSAAERYAKENKLNYEIEK